MKAQIEKFQQALDYFMENPFWKGVYEKAPSGAKAWLEGSFYPTWVCETTGAEPDNEAEAEADRQWKAFKPKMKKADWEYLIPFARHPKQKEAFAKYASECAE